MSDTTAISETVLQDLRSGFLGEIVTASAPDYDEARKVWNGCIDKRPALIVRPKSTDDIVAAVRFARAQGLVIAVRCGGHSLPGYSTCDDGLVIDLRSIADVEIDPAARVARVGGGALLGDMDRAAQEHGMAVPVGVVAHTGVGGLTLGGGLGRLQRMHGLTIDNLLSVEMVTADGRIVRASETENPDLFWGIRGAGANFGIVTSFEFRLHHIGTEIDVAMGLFTLENAPAALDAFGAWSATAPESVMAVAQLTVIAPGGPFPPQLVGTPVLLIPGLYLGAPEGAQAALAPLAEVATPIFAGQMRVPYLMLQQMTDEVFAWGKRYYVKGAYIQAPTAAMAEVAVRAFTERPGDHCDIAMLQMGGAISRVPEDATAFTGRTAPFFLGVEAAWADATEDEAHRTWVRRTYEAMRPFFAAGNYVNAADDTDEVRAVYGDAKYDKLVALKRTWDPDNVFRLNGNITP